MDLEHSSNLRKAERSEISSRTRVWRVFTAPGVNKNADWNQRQLTLRHFGQLEQRKSSVLFPIQSERNPDSGFYACDLWKDCIVSSSRKQITEIRGEGMIAGYKAVSRKGSKEENFRVFSCLSVAPVPSPNLLPAFHCLREF